MKLALALTALVAATTLSPCEGQGQDATLVSGSWGSAVVMAVVDRIRSNCVFSEDRLFLRRAAYVASRDGADSATYRTGFDGGIWQISQSSFLATQQCSSRHLQAACSTIATKFQLQWSDVTWSDLRKPLYSGLAAALNTLLTLKATEMPGKATDQAKLWVKMYGGQESDFFSLVGQSNSIVCRKNIDVTLVLDSSSSVSVPDFDLMKRFAADVASAMDIDGGLIRMADIVYASSVTTVFNLNTHTQASAVKQGFLDTLKIHTNTNTALALDEARRMLDSISSGARPYANKVVVLVTDGQSENRLATEASAKALRKLGATVFAIGVGNYDLDELQLVVSDPVCSHVLTLTSFDVIHSILTEIQTSICDANVRFDNVIQGRSSNPVETTYETPVPPCDNTVVAKVTCGILNIYTSTTDPRPGPAVYDDHYVAKPNAPAVLTIVQTDPQGSSVYITVVGTKLPATADGLLSCKDFNWTLGVEPVKVVKVYCEENDARRNCTSADLVGLGLCQEGDDTEDLPNPCTQANLATQNLRHPHPYSPVKFLQCDLNGQYYVTTCPGGVTFNMDTRQCGFTSPPSPRPSVPDQCTAQPMDHYESSRHYLPDPCQYKVFYTVVTASFLFFLGFAK